MTGGGSGLGLDEPHVQGYGARVAIVGPPRGSEQAVRQIDPQEGATSPSRGRAHPTPWKLRWPRPASLGEVDVLVNNAAGSFLAPPGLSPRAFDAVVRIVLHGTFHMSAAVGRRMIAAGKGGSILNILTTYAWTGSAFVIPSAAAKAGVLAMTRSLAVEWAAYGIRCNALCPGERRRRPPGLACCPSDLEKGNAGAHPLGRFGKHGELANLATFMVSDGAAYMNGDCVTLDGGAWLGSGGLFNWLAREPRGGLKQAFQAFRAGS